MRILVFIFLCFFLAPNLIFGQISFHNIYSSNGYDKGFGIAQLEDSSYMVTGSSSSFQNNSQGFLLHIDSVGNFISSTNYGGSESDIIKRVLYKPGFGFFLAGTTNSFGNGSFDALLMKVDQNGVLEWQKSYGNLGWDRIHDAVLTRDTGVMMVGEIYDTASLSMNIYMVRTNKFGDTLWTKNIGSQGEDKATSVIRVQDSMYVVGGAVHVADSGFAMGYVCKINDFGVVQWSDTIGDSFGPYEINDLVEMQTGMNVIGCRYDNTLNSGDNYKARMDLNGNLLNEDTYQSPGNTVFDQIGLNGNQTSLFIAYRYQDASSFQDGYDLSLARFTFGMFWDNHAMVINNPMEEKIEDLVPTSDGGLIAVGYNKYPVNGGSNIFVVKIDSNDVFPSSTVSVTIPLVNLHEMQSNRVVVYPNPFTDQININLDQPMDVILMDAFGKVLEEFVLKQSGVLNLGHLKSGVYYLLDKKGSSKAIKIIK